MRFRTGLMIGAMVGYAVGARLTRRAELEEDVETRGRGVLSAMARHPSAHRLSGRGLEALRRARSSIQRRLEASADDVSMN
jgi:hypothetical protein